MVLCVKVALKDAQKVKRFIAGNNLSDMKYSFQKTEKYIFFPILKKSGVKKEFPNTEFVEKEVPLSKRKKSLRETVLGDLSEEEQKFLKTSFDTTGEIAILEIPPELEKKEKKIANALLETHKQIKTVLKKVGIHGTEFRTQKMKYISGEKTKETIHKEHGTRLFLDVEKVYFSPRLSTERKRVLEQVKPGEKVLVMFSGCAPYPCVISKNTEAAEIIGIELNPFGHDYGVKNVMLNKLKNITLINGDVAEVAPSLDTKFDRIVMPLPKSAGDFLEAAFSCAKKGTIVHFYAFMDEEKFEEAAEHIKKECALRGISCKILEIVKCGQQSPHTFRICVDFKIVS